MELPLNKRRGFSLPEMLIVLMIISIFSGLAIVSYSGFRNYLRVRSAAQEVVSLLSAARAMAINQNGYFRVGFNIDNGTFWVDEVDSFGTLSQPKIIHPLAINDQIKLISVRVEDNFFLQGIGYTLFRPDATAQYCVIYLLRVSAPDTDENYYTIRVFPGTGKAKVYPNQRR